jgi:hypothetical protein
VKTKYASPYEPLVVQVRDLSKGRSLRDRVRALRARRVHWQVREVVAEPTQVPAEAPSAATQTELDL